MTTALYLARGGSQPTPSDYVDLMSDSCFLDWGTLDLGDYDPAAEERTITMVLALRGATADAVQQSARAIETKLWEAQQTLGSGAVWLGAPVALWYRFYDSPNFLYFDVVSGRLYPVPGDDGPTPQRKYMLTLHTLPWARADAIVENPNMVGNGGFETDTGGWLTTSDVAFTSSGATLVRSTAQAAYGTASGHLTTPGSAAFEGARYPIGATVAGQAYTAAISVRAGSGTPTVHLLLGNTATAQSAEVALSPTTGGWLRGSVTWVSDGAASTDLVLRTVGTAAVDVYLDGVKVEVGSVATPYNETLTNGQGATRYYPNIPGDLPALCRAIVADVGPQGALATPAGVGVTTSTAGGTLAAVTAFGYRVAAGDGNGGLTLASATQSVTTGAGGTNANTVTWQPVAGAGEYRVYGRTGGSELLIAILPNTATTYTDNGTVTPAGALPGANTSRWTINRVRLATRSAPGMLATDFTPVLKAVAAVPTTYRLYLGGATGGTYTLSFGGQTTGAISYQAQAQAVQAAFTGLSSVGAGNARVTGSGSLADPFVIAFTGTLAGTVQGAVTWASSLTGASGAALTRTSPTTLSDTTAMGGTAVRLAVPTGAPVSAATVVQPATGAYQAGTFDVFARVRDWTAGPGTPTNMGAQAVNGTLTPGTYNACAVGVDGAGNLSAASPIVSLNLPAGGGITGTWQPAGTVVNHRLYYQGPSGGWKYVVTASAYGTGLVGADTGTTGNPPTAPSVPNCTLLPLMAVMPTTLALARNVAGRSVQTQIANGIWEDVYLGPLTLPPLLTSEGGVLPRWLLTLLATTTSTAAPNLDIDGVSLLPVPTTAGQDQLTLEASGLQSYTPYTWLADTRRDERASCQLTDQAGNPQGQAAVSGRLRLGPGNAIVVAQVEGPGGASDVVSAQFSLGLSLTPRFKLPRGVA